MQYLVMAAETPEDFEAREDPDRSGPYWQAWQGYIADLTASGILVSAAGLQPPGAATTVRLREGRRLVQDGPYAETKEQLGGYFLIEVEDLDAAIAWAARCPSSAGAGTEVRPVLPPPVDREPAG